MKRFTLIICAAKGDKREARSLAVHGLKAAGIKAHYRNETKSMGEARYVSYDATEEQVDACMAAARAKSEGQGWSNLPLDAYLD